jgi:transposase
MVIIKQCIGIDVSKEYLDCCIGSINIEQEQKLSKTKKFRNTEEGFKELREWVNSERSAIEVIFVMEATGVYYENLAYWLNNQDEKLCILLPNKVKHFAKSLNIKTKTDSKDAQLLSRLGLERKLDYWKIPSKTMREIKALSREYRETKTKLVLIKNQLHAKSHSYCCPKSTEKRIKRQIKLLETQLLEIEKELKAQVKADSTLSDKIAQISTIPGVGFITVVCILAETNAFALVSNAKQLVSYSGLDIQHNQSGLREGKTKISKKGNSFIRNALYMPALCASKHNPNMKAFYSQLCERKPAKKIAVTAVARKLLILMYTLWKTDTEFDADYQTKTAAQIEIKVI